MEEKEPTQLCNEISSVDDAEIEHFSRTSERWWSGKSTLHSLNNVRVPFICKGLVLTKDTENSKPLENIKILEVGCGGGILSEELARLGAIVHAIDPGSEAIEVAKRHALLDPSLTTLSYILTTVEDHAIENSEKYDAVIASEVIEHVTEKELFLESCIKCLKPNGSIFITTYNKTIRSWIMGILVVQEIFNIIPRGTHAWDKFVSPSDVTNMLEKYNCKTLDVQGSWFNILSRSWVHSSNTSLNYSLHAKKIV